MKTLLLVDGSSYLYRAFHAMPDLRNRNGEPTGAVYGVTGMLKRLRREIAAEYMACIFDAKGRTFRDDLFAEYKANRAAMPAELEAQIPRIHEVVRALGWPLLMVDGVEADDVIGTLCAQATAAGLRTVVSTGDKDMAQLVDDHVTLVNTMTEETLDPAGVAAKFGVAPERIVDWLALIGDTVDNVPGVAKVGPKTAVKWLAQYGSLDAVIANADAISGVVGDNLRAALGWLPTSRALLTIRRDVPLSVTLDDLVAQPVDAGVLTAAYERAGFRTWLAELKDGDPGGAIPRRFDAADGADAVAPAAPVERHYETLLDLAALDRWIEKLHAATLTALDTETTSLDPMRARIVGLSFAVEPHAAAYLPLAHAYPGAPDQIPLDVALERLRPWLEDASRPKLLQNAKYDLHVCLNHGIRVRGVVHDTLLASYVLESHRPHDMDALAVRHLGVKTIPYADVAGKGASQIGFDQVGVERATEYSAEDADITLQLCHAIVPRVEADPKLARVYRDIELPVMPVLLAMERHGVLVDGARLAAQS
nr:DNA polymerase I [Burkholderiales bacterium]